MSNNASAHQIISLYSYSPSVSFVTDAVLETPRAIFPNDGSTFCPPTQSGTNSGIILEWTASTSATEYIVQLSRNSSFSGPTLRARTTTNTYYELQLRDDILLGETVYWRVMAKNSSGGLSAKSLPRSVTYDCPIPQISGKGDSKAQGPSETTGPCQNYNVELELKGPEEVLCCDRQTYYLDVTYSCKDAWGRDIVSIDSVTWSRSKANATVNIENSSTESAQLYFRAENSERVTLKATVTFNDILNSATFSCYVTKQITIDCDTGIPTNKPWLFEYMPKDVKSLDSRMRDDYESSRLSNSDYLLSIASTNNTPVLYPSWVDVPEATAVVDAGNSGFISLQRFITAGPVSKVYKEYSIPSEVPWNPFTGEVYTDYEYCFRVKNIGYTEEHVLESRTHGVIGCGLDVYSVNGGANCLQVNASHIAGDTGSRKGLRAMDGSYCSLEVYYGCGLTLDGEQLALDFSGIAGDGITLDNSGACPKLVADGSRYVPGCGLFYNSTNGTLDVERGDLIGSGNGLTIGSAECDIAIDHGCGLTINATSGELEVVPADLAGAGLISGGSGCALDVNLGCGLTFDGDAIDVDGSQLAGDGLRVTGECTLHFNYGKGLYTSGDKAFAYIGCGLEFDALGRIKADAATLAGNGLGTNDADNCELYVDVGNGLVIEGDKVRVNYGCGLNFNAGAVVVKHEDLAGSGLTTESTCAVRVGQGCGIIVTADAIQVDSATLAGNGLTTSGTCGLSIGEGCGISVGTNAISVDRADLLGLGLTNGGGVCNIQIDNGCGLKFTGNQLEVDNAALAGDGLSASGDCALTVDLGNGLEKNPQVAVKTGCGIQFDGTGSLEVNNTQIAGDGLKVGANCSVNVNYSDGLITENDFLYVNYGPGLYFNSSGQVQVYAHCGLWFYNDTQLRVHPSALAKQGVGGLWYDESFNAETGSCGIYPNLGHGLKIGAVPAGHFGVEWIEIKYGCGLGLETDPTSDVKKLKVDPNDLTGPAIRTYSDVDSDCQGLSIITGDGLRIFEDKSNPFLWDYSLVAFPKDFAGKALYSNTGYDLHVDTEKNGNFSLGTILGVNEDGKSFYMSAKSIPGEYSTTHNICFYLYKNALSVGQTADGLLMNDRTLSQAGVDSECFSFATCNDCTY